MGASSVWRCKKCDILNYIRFLECQSCGHINGEVAEPVLNVVKLEVTDRSPRKTLESALAALETENIAEVVVIGKMASGSYYHIDNFKNWDSLHLALHAIAHKIHRFLNGEIKW